MTNNFIKAIVLTLVLSCCSGSTEEADRTAGSASTDAPATIVLDASDFIDRLAKDHYITDAGELEVPWLFNNTGLVMATRSNYVIDVAIPEAGTYYLFTRTHGDEDSYFRVAIDDQVIEANIGDRPLHWEQAGTFELEKGMADLRLMRIENNPVLDVLVLTKDENFSESDLKGYELHPDVELLKSYDIPAADAVKFGDLTGDGRMDFLLLTPEYSAHAFSHEGKELWSWEAPAEYIKAMASYIDNEPPGLVWDLDGDGAAEAIHWRYQDGDEWLVAADGQTGKIKNQTPWPTRPLPHVYNNFRLAIGNLDGGYPDEVIVFTDMGGQINVTAYNSKLERLWQHEERKKKDHLGHYVYPVDLDEDSHDEVVVGSLVLDSGGQEIWNRFDLFYDNHDHVDSYRFADIDHDGEQEIVTAHSEVGVVAYEAMTGEILWQDMAEHAQQVATGDFLAGVEAPQIVIGARTYGNRRAGEHYLWAQVQWFSPDGELVGLWPEKPVNGNPVFVKGDWNGDGKEELFWYKFKMLADGTGELYFPDPVYHMFDFMGNRAEEVVTLDGGLLRIYGSGKAQETGLPKREQTPEYLKLNVTNHTHY